jgi:hypothetical protein
MPTPLPSPATDPRDGLAVAAPGDWKRLLRRHIGWVITVKLVLLTLLFVFFFSASHRPEIGASQVSDRIQLESATP